jgi:uncharacterized protein, YhcH/YjgK/YiaL family
MILDTVENFHLYTSLHPSFEKVREFLKAKDLSSLSLGKHVISGDDIFVSIVDAEGREAREAQLEVHIEYIDIQFPLALTEGFGYKSLSSLNTVSLPYDKNSDIAFYSDEPSAFIKVNPGEFVAFFPQDGHMPCIYKGKGKKAIFKIKL